MVCMSAQPTPGIGIEVRYFRGCPNIGDALAVVRRCVAALGLDVEIVELEGDYPSPTVRVNGSDVVGDPGTLGRACRCELPTAEAVMDALRAAMREVAT
jgi:hypothetical protein